jgi:hypothetical protein
MACKRDRTTFLRFDATYVNHGDRKADSGIKLDRVLIAEIAEQEHEIHLIQQKIRKLYRDRAAKLQEFDHKM